MLNRSAESAGFSVRLEGASLFDLIQFECMDPVRKILRVTAQGRVGTLFFRDGNLVHAAVGDIVGESAVRAMLTWLEGHVTPASGPWPAVESIGSSWQSVLLHAATANDEVSRIDNVVSFPSREPSGMSGEEFMSREPSRPELAVHDARITASGDVVAPAADVDTAEVLAYVADLADVIGRALALDRVHSIEVFGESTNAIAVRDERRGEFRAVWAPKDVDTARLRERAIGGER